MQLLITGICGFVGSVLARELCEARPDWKIVGFDNLSRRGSETNLEPLRRLGIEVRVGELLDQEFLAELPRCDWILDCAANPSVLAGVDGSSSRSVVEQNLYGTVNLLELARKWAAGFLLLSTSRVYSIPPLAALPQRAEPTRFCPDDSTVPFPPGLSHAGLDESFSTAAPISLYGSTKLCSEALALEYGAAFGFPVWINRCGVLAGAGQFGKADQGIFSFWLHSWKAGRPLRYLGFGGSGRQVRDCLHPRDLVPLLLQQFATANSPDRPQIVHCAGGITQAMSLRELSDWCAARWGAHPRCPELTAPPPNEPHEAAVRPFDLPWLVLDSALAGKIWHWQPQTPLESILEEIATHAETHPEWLRLTLGE